MPSPRRLESYAPDSPLATAIRSFCLEGFAGPPASPSFPSVPAWQALRERGTELWLDTGDIDAARRLWCSQFTALTTNNTLLNKEVQKGIYDQLVPRAAAMIKDSAPGIADEHLVLELAFVLNAAHALKLVEQFDAKVSVELHTDLAHDIEASVAYGRRYHAICPSHFYVKVPLTPSGIVAARRLADAGIPVNFTLGFSARQNLLVARAARPAFCNVFMGRINAFIADRGLGDGQNAGERATAASQLAIAQVRETGECATRQIGASMRGPAQVPALAGLDVYTMPTPVAQGFLEEGLALPPEGWKEDFPVAFAAGVDEAREGLGVFWEIDPNSAGAIDGLPLDEIAALDGEALASLLAAGGDASFFPTLTATESQRIATEGKIPTFEPWRDEVRRGRLAWDSLLTTAGLASFGADQAQLDQRIRGQL